MRKVRGERETMHVKPTFDACRSRKPATGSMTAILATAVVLLIATAWRLMGIDRPQVWHDEACTLWYMRASWLDLLLRLPWSDNHSPLAFAIFKLWGTFASSEPGLRLQSVLFGVAAVGLIIGWVRMIEPRAAWLAGLFAAVSPMLVHYSQELRMYSLMLLCCAAGFYFAERSVRSERRAGAAWWVTFWAIVAGNLHAVGLAVFPMLATYWLIRNRGPGLSRRRALTVSSVWLACVLPMVWLSIHWTGIQGQSSWWVTPPDTRTFAILSEALLGLDLVSQWERRAAVPDKLWWAFAAERGLLLCPALLLGAALLRRHVRPAAAAMLAAAVVYLAILVAGSRLALPVLIARTAMPAMIPLIAAAALGFGGKAPRVVSSFVFTIGIAWAVLLGGLWVWAVYRGPERRSADHAAYAFIRQSLGPDDVIVCSPWWVEYSAAYHLGDAIRGEQLVGSFIPAFTDKPVRLKLGSRAEDPHWIERLTQLLAQPSRDKRVEAGGRDPNVWHVQYGLLEVSRLQGAAPTEVITRQGFKSRESFVFGELRPLVVTRFCRDGASTRP